MLQEAGYLSISELCNTFDLPFDFLLEVILPCSCIPFLVVTEAVHGR